MPFPNPDTQFKPGNPGGGRPKGSKSWSTVVRELLEDENFEVEVMDKGTRVKLKYPAKLITDVMIRKAVSGDTQAARWLRETGYGNKIDITSNGDSIIFTNQVPRPDDGSK